MSDNHHDELVFPSAIDQEDFLHFALFDTFRVKRRWRSPVFFTCMMSAFSALCFALRNSREQASLLGGILLAIGLILPSAWFLLYLSSVRKQAKALGLSKERTAYSIFFGENGLRIIRGEEAAEYAWKDLHMAWRVKGCIYLYVLPERAFLLPEREESDAAWHIICRSLPEQKRKDLR